MSFWTAAAVIVAITTFGTLYRAKIKADSKKSNGDFEALLQRIDRLEDRMANLETIVLEKEKTKQFSDL
jgi:hypothetical protein